KLIGAVQGHELAQQVGDVRTEVSFESGHKLHRVDADIDFADIADPKELLSRLVRLVPKPGKKPSARQKR
ncbi:MAG TPA: hypothetical protein VJ728_01785, partial [Candidatus Binataceae bacterium]|nr:hypothetical protein [Candidatus Binataceae bacterium]